MLRRVAMQCPQPFCLNNVGIIVGLCADICFASDLFLASCERTTCRLLDASLSNFIKTSVFDVAQSLDQESLLNLSCSERLGVLSDILETDLQPIAIRNSGTV